MMLQRGGAARSASRRAALLPLLTLLLALGGLQQAAAQATHTVYCNVTAACRKCQPQHMQAEACRSTGYSEHLACWANKETGSYEVELRTRRSPAAGATAPTRFSRSCDPGAPEAAPRRAGGQWRDGGAPAEVSASKPMDGEDGSAEDGGAAVAGGGSSGGGGKEQGQLSVGDVAGSMRMLHFTVAMAVVLGCSLPVVFVRKRRALGRGLL